ncbi:MAG: LLM class flavin-dependent oxidoreductase [Sphingobium sp.]
MKLITIPSGTGAHFGGWRHPKAYRDTAMSIEPFVELTKMAERAKFDSIFIADHNSVRHMDRPELFAAMMPSDRPVAHEPVTLLSALAMVTRNIGLAATCVTTYDEPYSMARKIGTLDHISNGRGAWNVVTGSTPADSMNFGKPEHEAKALRYHRASEFLDVVKGLWDSWADDAFVERQESGQYLDPSRVRTLDHQGEYYSVKGPLNLARTPQGRPVLFSAGQSDGGRDLAARHMDCMFANCNSKQAALDLMDDVKGRLDRYGRHANALKIIPGISVYVGQSRDEADDLYHQLNELVLPELGVDFLSKLISMDLSGHDINDPMPEIKGDVLGINAYRNSIGEISQREKLTIKQTYQRVVFYANHIFKGNARDVADELEDWFTSGACDGFMMSGATVPYAFANICDYLIPELQRRKLFRSEYEGRTLRENLGLPTPANTHFA